MIFWLEWVQGSSLLNKFFFDFHFGPFKVRSNVFSVGMNSGDLVYSVIFFLFFISGLLRGLTYYIGKNYEHIMAINLIINFYI